MPFINDELKLSTNKLHLKQLGDHRQRQCSIFVKLTYQTGTVGSSVLGKKPEYIWKSPDKILIT